MANIRAVAHIKARSDKVEEMRAVLTALLEPTRREDGCVSYILTQNLDDPTDFTFIEEWESREAIQAHLGSAHVAEALSHLPEVGAADPDIRTYEVLA